MVKDRKQLRHVEIFRQQIGAQESVPGRYCELLLLTHLISSDITGNKWYIFHKIAYLVVVMNVAVIIFNTIKNLVFRKTEVSMVFWRT